MVEIKTLDGAVSAEPIWWKIKASEGGCSGANMVENKSLRGVGAAEPILWKIKALEGWVQRSRYGGKAMHYRGGCSGADVLEKSKP